ncbi:uncharacterized protein C8R40DRAFT_1119383 [Lentinula edodes]|uniref:uncharacterized protein n=1 Tax=Lentinula edodes TaxID=5353 RepID=UPI001E8E9639|nr:uncharacterized protein C8R40DRAFT_1119383 [Lentinula edodes]KAH7872002.1 hypothetical protein C8R40DRAFT_1119383 [Lentinula edodes]
MLDSAARNVDDDEWQVVLADWPRIHFEAISWTHNPPGSHGAPCKAICRPPTKSHYLVKQTDGNSADLEQELNAELVGVSIAFDVLTAYEATSGFHYNSCLDVRGVESTSANVADISCQIDEKDVAACKKNWNEIVQSLTGDFAEDRDTSSSSGSDSGSLASSLMFDSSDCLYPNYVSMPSTPKPHAPSSYGAARSSPSVSPHSKLNAFASSFTPSGSSVPSLTFSNNASPLTTRSSPSPTLHDFVFPSLNSTKVSSYPKLKIEKDDQGFYTNMEAETELVTPKSHMHPSTLLPAFLQDDHIRRKGLSSKTRALVDRLRSRQSTTTHEESGYNLSPSPVDSELHDSQGTTFDVDDSASSSFSESRSISGVPSLTSTNLSSDTDGWIGLEELHRSSPPKSRKRNGPNLSLSTTPMHRRTGSGPAALETEPQVRSPSSSSSQGPALSSSSSSSSSSILSPPTPPVITNNDGWIEVSEISRKKSISFVPTKKPSRVSNRKMETEPLTFPTLNATPQTNSRSHTRNASSAGSSKSTKAYKSAPAGVLPLSPPAPASNYGYYVPPALPVAPTVSYAPYAVNPMTPYATMMPQYYPHQYAYQQQHTHPQQYPYHHRGHSVAVPSIGTMPASYVIPNATASPMTIRLGMW